MWPSGLAVLQNLHTAKSGETLCASEAGGALSFHQFPMELLSLQNAAVLEGAVHSLKDSSVSLDSPYLVSHSYQKGFELDYHIMRWPWHLSPLMFVNHRLLVWKLLLQASYGSMLQ